jgi:cell division protein FtsB
MRLLTLILLLLLGGLQYDLWLGKNGLSDYRELSTAIERQQQDNLVLKDRNSLIYREIDDLTSGLEAIEELSRNDLGYIKQGETFYRIIPKEKDQVTEPDGAPTMTDSLSGLTAIVPAAGIGSRMGASCPSSTFPWQGNAFWSTPWSVCSPIPPSPV